MVIDKSKGISVIQPVISKNIKDGGTSGDFFIDDIIGIFDGTDEDIKTGDIVYLVFDTSYYPNNEQEILNVISDVNDILNKDSIKLNKIVITRISTELEEYSPKMIAALECCGFVNVNNICGFERSKPMVYANTKSLNILISNNE